MMSIDRTALYCDLAETYHVYGFDSLPVEEIAMLAVGLHEDSRIKQKISGVVYPSISELIIYITDNLSLIRSGLFMKKEKPYLVSEHIISKHTEETHGFDSGEEFDSAWKKLMEG